MVKERPFSQETINFFLPGKKTTSFVSFFQITEVRSQTIYESKNVFQVNEKTVFFVFVCLFVVVFFNTVFS